MREYCMIDKNRFYNPGSSRKFVLFSNLGQQQNFRGTLIDAKSLSKNWRETTIKGHIYILIVFRDFALITERFKSIARG
jgi:hypothetical protein